LSGQVFMWHKAFWMAARSWKANLILEDLALQKWKKLQPKWGLLWGLIDIWQSDWSVVSWIWNTKPSTIFWPKNWACRHFDYTSRLHSQWHCHLHELSFDQKVFVLQPPYLSEQSWCDIFLFPKLKLHLKDRHFGFVNYIHKVVTDQLRSLTHEDFQHCYWECEKSLQCCVASQGNYFEGDDVNF
jgi:hypothetical protein